MKVSIKKAASSLGVTIETVRRWEREGKIQADRTKGGHRRYDLSKLLSIKKPSFLQKRAIIAYARVSCSDQKEDLIRQVSLLETYCASRGWEAEVIRDMGSGLNYSKKGLKVLIKKICSGEIEKLVLTHKDRLLRFGSELIFALCEHFGTEVILIHSKEEVKFEEDLAQDVLEIITVFSARLYGSRSHKNRKLMQELKEVADGLST